MDNTKLLLTLLKGEAASMFHEDRKTPLEDWDKALRSDFCRFITMLINRVEKRLESSVPWETQKTYQGKQFTVTINREEAERRYVLQIFNDDGTMTAQNEPLKMKDFEDHFGFVPEWPYEQYGVPA